MSEAQMAFHLTGEQAVIAMAMMGVGLAYAAWFKSTRGALGFIVFIWLVAGLGFNSLAGMLSLGMSARPAELVVQLLPLNLLLVAILPLPALRSPGTFGFLALLLVQMVVAIKNGPALAASAIAMTQSALGWLPFTFETWVPLVSFAVAGAFVLRWVKSDQPNDIAMGIIATVLIAWNHTGLHSFEYVMGAGMLLMLAVLYGSHRLAFYDALTGIRNRRSLDAALETLGRRYAIAMLDIDHFKQVNDRFGHDFGDQVLKAVATRLKRLPGFTLYRYGGEEFCLLFRGRRRVEQAAEVCELARETVEEAPVAMRAHGRPRHRPVAKGKYRHKVASVKVTVSVGLARAGEERAKPELVREAADKALYRAKKNGRNQVIVAR